MGGRTRSYSHGFLAWLVGPGDRLHDDDDDNTDDDEEDVDHDGANDGDADGVTDDASADHDDTRAGCEQRRR